MKRTILILLFVSLIGTISAVFWQEVNLSALGDDPISLNGMISSADEPSYLQPPQNWLQTGEWKDNTRGASSYTQRPPGYGVLFLLCKAVSPENPYVVLKFFQILGFFFSIYLVGKIILSVTSKVELSIFSAALYGLLPCFSGFMYYSLTEGVTPFLMLALTYQFIRVFKTQKNLFWFGLVMMVVLLIRPQLVIFPALYSLILFLRQKQKWYVFVLAAVPFVAWQVRSYNIFNSVSIHPIYSYTNASLYRPPHEALTNLFRVWEYRSDHFHGTVSLLAKDTSQTTLMKALKRIPSKFQHDVEPILKEFQHVVSDQKDLFALKTNLAPLESEVTFVEQTNQLAKEIRGENILDTYFLTPLKSSYELLNKSHMNLSIFQTHWRGSPIVELIRWFSLLLIVTSILSVCYLLISFKFSLDLKIVALGILATILYLVFIQRLNEERYMTPMLPLALVLFVVVLHSFLQKKDIKKG